MYAGSECARGTTVPVVHKRSLPAQASGGGRGSVLHGGGICLGHIRGRARLDPREQDEPVGLVAG